MNEIKICLLGGDSRQTALAYYLAQKGFETAVWGLPMPASELYCGAVLPDFDGVRCTEPESAVAGSRAVLLPLPATTDGVRVHTPALNGEAVSQRRELRLTQLMDMLEKDTLLLAGRPGEVLRSMARNANIRLVDYYDSEAVQIKNAVPTAEGALALAMEKMPFTIFGSSCAVLGYGRIGQRLCSVLLALGARITVAARSERDLSSAAIHGCTARPLREFLDSPGKPDVLFNTIPVPLIREDVLRALPPHTLIMDLASAPGGIDPAAQTKGDHRILRAASLPGRAAPYTAGKILFETIESIFAAEGITV